MTTTRLQTHASIDTTDLAASVSFYQALLGADPALERHDYARFDLAEPPLVLGLNSVEHPSGPTGALEHLGVRFADEADLEAARRRLEGLAVTVEEEPDTECCYSSLGRLWATDPSGVRWELFVVREAVVDASSRAGGARSCCEPSCCASVSA